VAAEAQPSAGLEREWLLRAVLVLQRPRAVFAALRSDDDVSAQARQEPIVALVLLAGIAAVLATSVAGALMDDPELDGLLVAVWAFLGGGLYGAVAYWVLGAFLYGASQAFGGTGSYRRARHVVAFAAAPLALALLVLWPVGVAAFGSDLFRTGGSDDGAGGDLFVLAQASFAAWSVALLAIGVRAVHGWTWARSLATTALALAPLVLFVIAERL
jgi:hypothetical protein